MKMKETLELTKYSANSVSTLDDMTLRNIIYQVHGEWNSSYTRSSLEQIGKEALVVFSTQMTEDFNEFLKTDEAQAIVNDALKPYNRVICETFGSGGFEANSTKDDNRLLVCCSPGWCEPNDISVQIQDMEEGTLEEGYEGSYPCIFTNDNHKNLQAYIAVLTLACMDADRLEKERV